MKWEDINAGLPEPKKINIRFESFFRRVKENDGRKQIVQAYCPNCGRMMETTVIGYGQATCPECGQTNTWS